MPQYKYKAIDKESNKVTGLVEATSAQTASQTLRSKKYFVLSIDEKIRREIPIARLIGRVSSSDVTDFTRQLATMIDAGLPLTKSLEISATQSKSEQMNHLLNNILSDVQGGTPLADALEKNASHFTRTYIALIQSGEASGTLDNVLNRLADNLEKNREFQNKVKGAMIYPTIVIIGMAIVGFIMMSFVVPKLTNLYTEFEVDLPIATKALITISNVFANYWYLILLAVGGLYFGFTQWKKTTFGRKTWDTLKIRIPLIGPLQQEIILIETARTLGILAGAGLAINKALEIVAEAVDNVIYKKGLDQARSAVEKGYPLGITIASNRNFPPIFAEMITIGEETGKLDETLQRLANFFETKSNESVRALTTAIEPLIMIVLGVGVGFLVLAIIMPIYNLTDAIK
ncbi:MAG: type II secretion system F family protein [bacterium]|nr:type II secretion system F family protein [bacterium]